MKIKCPHCNASYTVDNSKITKDIVKTRCRKCNNTFAITKNPQPTTKLNNKAHTQSLIKCPNCGLEQVKSNICIKCGDALKGHDKANLNKRVNIIKERCFYHADLKVRYKCTSCLKTFCKDCIKEIPFGNTKTLICPECGELAELIKTNRLVSHKNEKPKPFWYDIPGLLIFPFIKGNVYSLIGASIVITLLNYFPIYGNIISYGVAMSYFFLIIENIASGKDDIPTPDFTSIWDDIIPPAWLGLCAVTIPFLPFIYYSFFQEVSPTLTDPLNITFLLIGIFFSPICLMIAAINKNVVDIINPERIVNIVVKIPIDYFTTVIFTAIFFLSWQFANNVISNVIGNVFLLNTIVESLLFLYFLFILGRMLGLVIYQNAEKLNYL